MHTDFLFIVAEIGAAFAGFASLVAAVSRRQDQSLEKSQLDFGKLQNAVVLSLVAVAFALFPSLVERQGVDPAIAWRGSAAVFSIVFGSYTALGMRRYLPSYGKAGHLVPLTLRVNVFAAGMSVIVLALCAAGALPTSSYLLALTAVLYMAGVAFLRFFISIGQSSGAA